MENACIARPLSLTVLHAHQRKHVHLAFQNITTYRTVSVYHVHHSMLIVSNAKPKTSAANAQAKPFILVSQECAPAVLIHQDVLHANPKIVASPASIKYISFKMSTV
jgi:hypothetical protein